MFGIGLRQCLELDRCPKPRKVIHMHKCNNIEVLEIFGVNGSLLRKSTAIMLKNSVLYMC